MVSVLILIIGLFSIWLYLWGRNVKPFNYFWNWLFNNGWELEHSSAPWSDWVKMCIVWTMLFCFFILAVSSCYIHSP